MDFVLIFAYLAFTIRSYVGTKEVATDMIEEIGTNSRYYPKHFMVTKRWVKKLFKVRDRVIPKFLYFELLLSLFYLILGSVIIVSYIAGCLTIYGILVMFHMCLIIINLIFCVVMSLLFKRK